MSQSRNRKCLIRLLPLVLLVCASATGWAGELQMKSGHVIRFQGKPTPMQGLTLEQAQQGNAGPVNAYPITMVDAVSRRYYVSQSQVDQIQLGNAFQDEFTLNVKPGPRLQMFTTVGGFINAQPFSEFGRRIVSLQGANKPIDVVQAISKVSSDYVELTSINHHWQYSVATKTLPPEMLRRTISQAINERNAEDRLAIVRMFVAAGFYREAQIELDRIQEEFPELEKRVNDLQLEIRQLRALEFVNEFQRRVQAGQYEFVYRATQRFPREDVNLATLQQVDRMQQEHRRAHEQIDLARSQLSRLQAKVQNPDLLQRFQDMRSVVEARLSRHTLERLAPFLQNVDDDFLSAEEKLALAYSGWVVGPAKAETDPDTTLNYWDARDRVIEYLRSTNPIRQTELISRLRNIEDVGAETLAAIVERLGPLYEPPAHTPGEPIEIELQEGSVELAYQVLLPLEYSPDRQYPLVLALSAGGVNPLQTLAWWGGDSVGGPAHRNGYIVIAPVWQTGHEPPRQQVALLLRDAQRRFAIDADRVFLAGHGQGADQVYDISMTRPDLFAGAIAITGRSDEYARHYWENCKHLPFYVVHGELDADKFKQNAEELNRMMKHRYDVVLVEYKQRGNEDYLEELPHILEWMRVRKRAPLPSEVEVKTMRQSDTQFYWMELAGLPEAMIQPRTTRSGTPVPPRPIPLKYTVTAGNTIYLTAGVERAVVWLSPEVVSFDQRLKIMWKGRPVYQEIPERDIQAMLQRVHATGDRQRLYWTRLSF